MGEPFDCTTCGACCQFAGEVVVNESDNPPKYLTRSVRGMMGFASYEADYLRRMARTEHDRCAALVGEVGGSCRCRIYERRPAVCREFDPGGRECLIARKRAGFPASSPRPQHGGGAE